MEANNNTTRCLFCSLACPVGVDYRVSGVVQPAYGDQKDSAKRGGLCYRGHYVSALMAHPRRLTSGISRRLSGAEARDHNRVMSEAAEAIRSASSNGSLGVVISGNLPCEEIAGAARFFQSALPARHVSVFLPPTDTAIIQGIAQSDVKPADREDIAKARSILAVGDVLGTHPLLAGELLDLREAPNRRAKLINIDAMKGRTMRFADSELLVRHGTDAQAMLALAMLAGAKPEEFAKGPDPEELLSRAGLSRSDADRCVENLREDNNSLILLTVAPGRCRQSRLLAAATGWLAQATGSKLLPLYAYGGSAGGYAVSQSLGLTDMGDWLKAAKTGEISTAFIAGSDIVGVLPDELVGEALNNVECVIAASAMPNSTTQRADITLPLAFWFEMAGEVIDHKGRSITLNALAKPPGGAGTLIKLVNQLARMAEVEPAASVEIDYGKAPANVSAGEDCPVDNSTLIDKGQEDLFVVTSRTENLDLYEGGISRQLDWVLTIEPAPLVLINPLDAKKLQLRDKDTVLVGSNGSQAEFCVRVSEAVPAGTVAVSGTIPEAVRFFDWRLKGGFIEAGPGQVSLNAAQAEDE